MGVATTLPELSEWTSFCDVNTECAADTYTKFLL